MMEPNHHEPHDMQARLAQEMAKGQHALAVRQFEHQIEESRAKVRNLATQIVTRLASVESRAMEVRLALNSTDEGERPFAFERGAFGEDTGTLDALLAAMGQQVDDLNNKVARLKALEDVADSTSDLMIKVVEEAEEGGSNVFAMPAGAGEVHGQYL